MKSVAGSGGSGKSATLGAVGARDEPVVIDDLAAPRLPDWFVELGETLGVGPEQRLDAGALRTEAVSRAGADDFGDRWFEEPFGVLVRSLEGDGRISRFGRFQIHELLVGLLVTRLRLAALLERHPEILETPVEAPVVVFGLPRTGTTHLHDLLSADPAFRSLPYWESIEPIPPGDGRPPTDGPDPRIERAELGLAMIHGAMPLFASMHAMTTHGPHEEIQLLAVDFSTMLFEASYDVPTYATWYRGSDQTHAYRTLRLLLQVLQWLRPIGTRWLLKSPQHLEQIRVLLDVFPDARIVHTHRDPVAVTASMATLAAYSRRTNYDMVDPIAVGRTWAERVESLLTAAMRDRDLVPAAQVVDIHFHEYMADQWSTIEAVYRLTEMSLTADVRARIQRAMDDNPRGRHGRVAYRLESVGLDRDERRKALRSYQERFAVPDEPVD